MRLFSSFFAALALVTCVCLSPPASAQTTGVTVVGTVDTVAVQATIGSSRYASANPVTYAKTATGLLMVLSPAELDGAGRLDGSAHGLTLEIPDSIFKQIF